METFSPFALKGLLLQILICSSYLRKLKMEAFFSLKVFKQICKKTL